MHLTTRIKKALFLPADVHLDNRSRALEIGEKEQVLAWEASSFAVPDRWIQTNSTKKKPGVVRNSLLAGDRGTYLQTGRFTGGFGTCPGPRLLTL